MNIREKNWLYLSHYSYFKSIPFKHLNQFDIYVASFKLYWELEQKKQNWKHVNSIWHPHHLQIGFKPISILFSSRFGPIGLKSISNFLFELESVLNQCDVNFMFCALKKHCHIICSLRNTHLFNQNKGQFPRNKFKHSNIFIWFPFLSSSLCPCLF